MRAARPGNQRAFILGIFSLVISGTTLNALGITRDYYRRFQMDESPGFQ